MAEINNLQLIYGKSIPSSEIARMCRIQNMAYHRITLLLKKMGAKPYRGQGVKGMEERAWIMP